MSKCLPTAGMEPSASSSHHPFPLILSMTTKSSLFISRVFPGLDIMKRKGASLEGILSVMHCVYRQQHPPGSPGVLPPFHPWRQQALRAVLKNTHDLLGSIYKIRSFSSVPVITPFRGGKCNWALLQKRKRGTKKQM